MHGCTHAPPERRGLHACATCCVCCGDGAARRWMPSAVWNSADPLKWLLAATGERERGWEATCVVACGQMSPPHPQQNTQHLCLVQDTEKLGLDPYPLIDSKSIIPLICIWTKAIHLINSAPFPSRKWIVCRELYEENRPLNEKT